MIACRASDFVIIEEDVLAAGRDGFRNCAKNSRPVGPGFTHDARFALASEIADVLGL